MLPSHRLRLEQEIPLQEGDPACNQHGTVKALLLFAGATALEFLDPFHLGAAWSVDVFEQTWMDAPIA